MTPEERFTRIESVFDKAGQDIDKQNDAIRSLIVVARTCLDSFQEIRELQRRDHEEWTLRMKKLEDVQAATDEKLNILIDTVDRIIRRDNKTN